MSSQKHILLRLLSWYFCARPVRIVRGYAAYAKALFEIVPFGFLLLTLFTPWKNIQDRTRTKGFNLNKFIERISLDLLARGTGCVVRILTIALGLVFQALLLAGSLTYLVAWLGFPVWATGVIFLAISSLR